MKKIIAFIVFVIILKWWFTDPSIKVYVDGSEEDPVTVSYIIKYTGGADSNDVLPLLIALHGNGDTVSNFYDTALDLFKIPMRIILLKAPIPYGSGSSWPGTQEGFKRFGAATQETIELLSIKFPTTGKPVLMGFSGGAMMAFYLALKHGDSYAHIFPISGMMTKNLLGEGNIRTGAKVLAFHGKSDNVVSINGGKLAAELLGSEGIEVEFIEFDGGHHGIFTNMKSEVTKQIENAIMFSN